MAPTFSFMTRRSAPAAPAPAPIPASTTMPDADPASTIPSHPESASAPTTEPTPTPTMPATDPRQSPKFVHSYHGQMPHVVVVPPEEDDEAPYTCFDAASRESRFEEARARDADEDDEDDDDEDDGDDPRLFHPNAHPDIGAHPNIGGAVLSVPDAFAPRPRATDDDDDRDPSSASASAEHLSPAERAALRELEGPGNDSEVIEVIKVRRHGALPTDSEDEAEGDAPRGRKRGMSRSGTFLAKALGKMRGKGSASRVREARTARDPSTAREGESEEPDARSRGTSKVRGAKLSKRERAQEEGTRRGSVSSAQPSMKRRRSATLLTNIFRPSVDGGRERGEAADCGELGDRAVVVERGQASDSLPPSPSCETPCSLTSTSAISLGSFQSVPSLSVPEEENGARAPSPTGSTRSTTKRRFSMLRLNRIFTSAGDAPADTGAPAPHTEPADGEPAAPALSPARTSDGSDAPSMSRESTPSTAAGSMPQTPVSESLPAIDDGAEQTPRPSHSKSERSTASSAPRASTTSAPRASTTSAPRHSTSSTISSSAYSASVGYTAAAGYSALPTIADASMEMQLDSLHFDDLSFDVDNFMEGVH
ncbi:hypothetical protein HDZ31DRAFT_65627 [Schizophyllum fasciatum]